MLRAGIAIAAQRGQVRRHGMPAITTATRLGLVHRQYGPATQLHAAGGTFQRRRAPRRRAPRRRCGVAQQLHALRHRGPPRRRCDGLLSGSKSLSRGGRCRRPSPLPSPPSSPSPSSPSLPPSPSSPLPPPPPPSPSPSPSSPPPSPSLSALLPGSAGVYSAARTNLNLWERGDHAIPGRAARFFSEIT